MNLKSSLKSPIFRTVSEIADELNYPTYVVGGWVRDLLLNRKQAETDIDFLCVGSGIKLAKNLAKVKEDPDETPEHSDYFKRVFKLDNTNE